MKYIYMLQGRTFTLYTYKKPNIITYSPKQIKQVGDWTVLNFDKDWNTTALDRSLYSAVNFKTQQYGYSNKDFRIDTTDTIHAAYYPDVNNKDDSIPYVEYTKSIRSVREVLEPLWAYSKRCAQNDTNTLGRWYSFASSAIRIFKKGDTYYELMYWGDGDGRYYEVRLERIANGIKVIPVFKNKELEKVSKHYKIIDFTDDYSLKHYIGSKEKIDDTFYMEPCYKYCEAETDSMFYYGYDTILHTYRKEEPIMLLMPEER